MSKLDEALTETLAEVLMAEWRVRALHFACANLQPRAETYTGVYAGLNDAYRRVLLIAGMMETPEAKEAMRRAAAHFLSKGMQVTDYLGYRNTWPVKDEDEFRAEIADWAEHMGMPRELFQEIRDE